jgi:2-(3-amino-3-carboxypropyl)histidine synthase
LGLLKDKLYKFSILLGVMQNKTIQEIEKDYDLELGRVVETIEKKKAKKVLLQFPDGMKPYSVAVVDALKERIKNIELSIWMGSCFGACDVPNSDADLIIQFGHSPWKG